MNENLNLVEILKDCPEGIVLYSTIYGYVTFVEVQNEKRFPIKYMKRDGTFNSVTAQGLFSLECKGECVLFPSKDQRDWSKFKVKKPKFDPKILKPFDEVLTRDVNTECWKCGLFSHIINKSVPFQCQCIDSWYRFCIPYNDDTKYLVGTTEEAPDFYRYWEE